jgi:hypothetical protein
MAEARTPVVPVTNISFVIDTHLSWNWLIQLTGKSALADGNAYGRRQDVFYNSNLSLARGRVKSTIQSSGK